MANSTYPVPIGRAGTGSSKRLMDAHEKGTIPYSISDLEDWRCEFDILLAGALDADTDQEFDLHTYLGSNPTKGVLFPANVVRESPCKVFIEVQAAGPTTVTAEVGDTGLTTALLTASNVHTGVGTYVASTPAAGQYARRIETDFIPTLRLRSSGGNISAITALRLTILIPFRKLPLVA